ncbi:MAG: hypothetical protein ACTHU0_36980 [Kofleriaceae bacterium]
MKISASSGLWFGLLVGACGSGGATQERAAYPLCDRAGAPACGNVGQVGRREAPAVNPPREVRPPIVQASIEGSAPARGTLLSAPPASGPAATPLIDRASAPACGNVMSKRGGRPCDPEPVRTAEAAASGAAVAEAR